VGGDVIEQCGFSGARAPGDEEILIGVFNECKNALLLCA
jgi:hypothetical protein